MKIQAVMRGALRQQTSLNLVLIALERYVAQVIVGFKVMIVTK